MKQELEEEVVAGDDDPETHYNLGVAFREMGLLDEAIAELQKSVLPSITAMPLRNPSRPTPGWPNSFLIKAFLKPRSAGIKGA